MEVKTFDEILISDFPKCLNEANISFWLDSSGGPENLCNKSLFGINPKYYFYGSLNEITLEDCNSGALTFTNENCFDFLEEKIKEEKNNSGIFIGYISYEIFSSSYKSNFKKNKKSYPLFFFSYFESAVELKNKLDIKTKDFPINQKDLKSNMTDEEYLKKVDEIKNEIKKGNVYQVNLTREYCLDFKSVNLAPFELYLKLRTFSPNPYSCFFKTPSLTILSSSPEEFLFIESEDKGKNRKIRTRPVKGTLPKNVFEIDEKNKAENIMIVDLERNDLGKVCKYGSIKVKSLTELEEYKHLNHVVSTIEGTLKENIRVKEIFESVFPGGSITGAPKIAAMKIINSIEPAERGAYTGCFGYIKSDGEMNFNILIRSIFVEKGEEKIKFNIGGGIVADSNPLSELEEIKIKSEGILKTLGLI